MQRYEMNHKGLPFKYPNGMWVFWAECSALLAERDRLREALERIDSLATRHEAGAIGKAQIIARAALRPAEKT